MGNKIINASLVGKEPTGLGIYSYNITKTLLSLDKSFIAFTQNDDILRLFPLNAKKVNLGKKQKGTFWHIRRIAWLHFILSRNLKSDDILYSPIPEGPLFFKNQIITIHDILPIRFPEYYPKMKYYFRYFLPFLLKRVRKIVFVSEFTKKEATNYYNIQDKESFVIYQGIDRTIFYPDFSVKRENYILFVGEPRPYKNLRGIFRAIKDLSHLNLKLYVIGPKKSRFFKEAYRTFKEFYLEGKVEFLGYVDNDKLRSYYQKAKALVFPSLYEGFGIPPLEAMACGCPVIASNRASLPEVCKEAAYYVDPEDYQSIAKGIYDVFTNLSIQKALIEKGLERANFFSWDKTAKQLINIIYG